jgi:lysylphosphatidylglycerol synthetase-like protein (DUF2156 family)
MQMAPTSPRCRNSTRGLTAHAIGPAPPRERVHLLLEHLTRFFAREGPHRYKAKFFPTWEERFPLYEGGSRASPRGLSVN